MTTPGKHVDPHVDGSAQLDRSEAAIKQLEQDITPPPPAPPPKTVVKRFYGRKIADPVRLVRDAGGIADAVLHELKTHPSAQVKVVIEVEATDDEGFGEDVQRVVSENARTLKFDEQEFSE